MFDLDQLTAIQRPTIRKKPWMEKKNFVLVTTATIAKVVDECIKSGYYALDLETTGLDNRAYNNTTIDHIVGACLSPDGETGYYLPLLHTDYMDKCIPNSVFKREMRRLTSSPAIAIFHNGKFDHEFLQFNGSEPLGEWDDPKVWEDTLILAYIRNTREKRKGLKHLSHTLLDMEMIELNELFSEEKAELDFSTLDPSWPPTLWYAASDAICTFLLYHRLRDEATKPTIDLPSQEPIYVIEKLGVTATRWMERNQIPIDRDKVVELIQLGQREWLPAMGVVFTEVSKALGRDVTPGYYRLLVGEDDRFRFNPDDVDLGITDNVNRAVAEAERKRMDPSDLDSKGKIRIHTIQKSMPSLVDKKQIETVEFPLVYDIRNPNQFGLMLRELGVPGLRVTEKSGQIQTTADEIDRVLEEAGDIFPYLAKVRRFREVARAITNNLMPLYKYTAKEYSPNGRIRINFEGHKVDTARFSTPKSTERKGWTGRIPWNIHSVPSGKKKNIPECLKRIRECIKAEKGSIIVACVAEGSLVQTNRGLIPIEKVEAGDSVHTDEGLKPVVARHHNGHREVLKLTTESGYTVRLTADHRVQVVSPSGDLTWKQCGDLKSGDWVCLVAADSGVNEPLPASPIPQIHTKLEKTPTLMDDSFAEFLGRLMGDGCITGSEKRGLTSVQFDLGLDAHVLVHHVNSQAENLFGLEAKKAYPDGSVHYASRSLARWLEGITLKGSTSVEDLSVPEAILRSESSNKAMFLRGLFDADGSVGPRQGDAVSVWITSDVMAHQVHLMLLGLGVPASCVQSTRTTNYGTITGWNIAVRGIRSLRCFQAKIGFTTPRKMESLNQLVDSRYREVSDFIPLSIARKISLAKPSGKLRVNLANGKRHGRMSPESLECARNSEDVDKKLLSYLLDGPIRFDTVQSVVPDGSAEVYDLTVPDGHRFSANGIVVHNCDFSGQELRVVTNLSRESMWENEFFRCSGCGHTFDRGGQVVPPIPEAPPPYCPECGSDSIGDIHTLTAQALYGADVTESPDFKEKRGNSKCVHPDTLLRTPNGLIRIGSLSMGAVDTFKPITGLQVSSSQAMIPVKEVYNGGLKKLYHVVTRRGVLTCSAEHQFMLANGELKTISDGLNKGDVLVEIPTYVDTDREYPRIPHSPVPGMPTMDIQTSPEMAYFAGLHAGDGSSSPACAHIVHGSVDKTDLLGVPYKDWQKIIADSVSAVGITPVLKNKGVYLGSRVFLRWMEAIGLLTGSKRNFRIPNWIFQAGREAILHYLGGLIDTDGSATIGGDLSITTKDYVFAGQIAEAFRAVGCVASVGLSFNTKYQRWYLKIAIKRCEGKILAPYMKHPGKIARISNTTSQLNAWSNEVLLILESTEQPCVDLHVDSEDHLYLANGLLTHNSVNFALCYGGGGMAVVRAAGVSKDEGWRIKRQFDNTYKVLAGWWGRQHDFARRTKHVLTAFNRRYPLPDIDSADGGFRAKAERNAVNGPIQSTGADIMKYSMGLIYRECKKRGWLDLCKIIITMHDEIVFEIAESIFVEALEMIKYIMLKKCIERLPWRVPLTCDIEAGIDWTVPWNVTKIQHGKQKMPDALKHVLAPVTVTKETTESSDGVVVSSDGGQMAGVANPLPTLGKGEDFVYVIRNADLTMRTMNKLAEVIHRCRGRGEHTLRVRTEDGHDLWEGELVKVNAGEFSVLINMPRL